jgi:hypothetical protein
MTPVELRALYADESSLHRLTSSAPPVVAQISEHSVGERLYYEVMLEEEPADRIGQSLSAEMVALIGAIQVDFVSYGPRHPIRRALAEWERSCRRRHRKGPSLQWRDHDGPLCGEMLYAVVNGASLWWCAQRWEVPYPRAERLIGAGIRFVAERYARWQDDALGIVHDRDHCEVCR